MTELGQVIAGIVQKQYQERTKAQHRILVQLLAPHFPILSQNRLKMLTFFISCIIGPSSLMPQQHKNSYVIIIPHDANPQHPPLLKTIKDRQIKIDHGETAILLPYDKYLNAQSLGDSTIQQQLSFWQSSQYFCSAPKKRFMQLIRLANVLVFFQGQNAYYQGQLVTSKESGSGVYVIRQGQFSYYHKNQNKQIQTCRFEEGHIFGSLQHLNQATHRVMSARCKTQKAIVYHFSQADFKTHILRYCHNALQHKQSKLLKFIPEKTSQSKPELRINPLRVKMMSTDNISRTMKSRQQQMLQTNDLRAFPSIGLERVRNTASLTFYSKMKQSQIFQQQSTAKWGYLKLVKDGPLKRYPLVAQRLQYISSDFKDIGKVIGGDKHGQSQQSGVWKRDMMHSVYRQSLYESIKRKSRLNRQ